MVAWASNGYTTSWIAFSCSALAPKISKVCDKMVSRQLCILLILLEETVLLGTRLLVPLEKLWGADL